MKLIVEYGMLSDEKFMIELKFSLYLMWMILFLQWKSFLTK